MKTLVLISSVLFLNLSIFSQEFKKVDKSPLDVAYFPANATKRLFAKSEEEKSALKPIARILYSRPQKKERVIFGNLVSFGEAWRIGANESTEIEFFESVKFGEKKIKAGRYLMYAVPGKESWKISLNSITDQWGVYVLDKELDIASITVPSQKSEEVIEALSIAMFEKDSSTFIIKIGWDKTIVEVPVKF